jgi:branched-chain amino acid transport system ATP-binding protein
MLMEDVPLLEVVDLSKSFGSFMAVDHVSFAVKRGSIHALIGPNGAGKTTCFNLLTKLLLPTSGRLYFKGTEITRLPASSIARLGICRSFQISSIFPALSVLENVIVALQQNRGDSFDFWRSDRVLLSYRGRALSLLAQIGMAEMADTTAATLAYGRKRALEIVTTIALQPDILLLDEPTAGMGREDIGRITALIKTVASGRTVLLIEHNLAVVRELCDRITVLARGRILEDGDYAKVAANPEVRSAYLGTAVP